MGEEISRERLALMKAALLEMEVEPEYMSRALNRAWLECKFFPRPAEIYEIAKREESAAEAAAWTPDSADMDSLEKMGERFWIGGKLRSLADAMHEQVSQDTISQMTKELIGIEPLRLARAIRRVRRECKRFPRPVEILERLPPPT